MRIEVDDLTRPQVHALLEEHLRRKGAGRAILAHIVATARQRRYALLSLETGSHPAFLPAQKLYQSFGFDYCGPFGDYEQDPNSRFMSLSLLGTPA